MGNDQVFFEFLKYLWNYFEFHAKQRITLFNFYTGFFIFDISAIGYLLLRFHKDIPTTRLAVLILVLSIFLILITRIFHWLDDRNRQLIHYAEESLRHLEKNIPGNVGNLSGVETREISIFTKENNDKINGRALRGHTECFRRLFYCAYTIGFILFITSVCKSTIIEMIWKLFN